MKQDYDKPNITAVTLDSEQTILQVCQLDAAGYMSGTGRRCMIGTGLDHTCTISVKGIRNMAWMVTATSAAPS